MLSEAELLNSQQELLNRLRREVGERDTVWNERYHPVILRMVQWFQLLPASREHHHFGAGGLLRHSLEAAIAASGLYGRVIIGQSVATAERARYAAGFQWAAVIGALLHDCAKPLTDMNVIGERTGEVWNPINGSLTAWANHFSEERYRIRWRPKRNGAHMIAASVMLPRIVQFGALAGLTAMSGQDVLLQLLSAVVDDEQEGQLAKIIAEADRISVADDVNARADLTGDHRIHGVAVEQRVLDAIRALLRDGVWTPGGKTCARSTDGSVILNWPKAGRDIANKLSNDGFMGLVSDPFTVADILTETGIADPGPEESGGNRGLHTFRFDDGLAVTGLRFRPDSPVAQAAIHMPILGHWQNQPGSTAVATDQPTSDPASTTADPRPATGSATIPSPTAETASKPTKEPGWAATNELANAVFEDLGIGKTPISRHLVRERVRYLAYPDCFKDYGMQPLAAVKMLADEGLVEPDGNRMAVDITDAPFKKGVKVKLADPPLPAERAVTDLAEWFGRQADDDVLQVGSKRYVSRDNFCNWASLYTTDPAALLTSMVDDGVIRAGRMRGIDRIRVTTSDDTKSEQGDL